MKNITLTKVEIAAGVNRVNDAEGLIVQLPKAHEGRNAWLLNYGVRGEAVAFRKKNNLLMCQDTGAAELRSQQLERLNGG